MVNRHVHLLLICKAGNFLRSYYNARLHPSAPLPPPLPPSFPRCFLRPHTHSFLVPLAHLPRFVASNNGLWTPPPDSSLCLVTLAVTSCVGTGGRLTQSSRLPYLPDRERLGRWVGPQVIGPDVDNGAWSVCSGGLTRRSWRVGRPPGGSGGSVTMGREEGQDGLEEGLRGTDGMMPVDVVEWPGGAGSSRGVDHASVLETVEMSLGPVIVLGLVLSGLLGLSGRFRVKFPRNILFESKLSPPFQHHC